MYLGVISIIALCHNVMEWAHANLKHKRRSFFSVEFFINLIGTIIFVIVLLSWYTDWNVISAEAREEFPTYAKFEKMLNDK